MFRPQEQKKLTIILGKIFTEKPFIKVVVKNTLKNFQALCSYIKYLNYVSMFFFSLLKECSLA